MTDNIKFIYSLFILKLKRTFAFRFDFFGATFVDGTMFALQLTMFNAIYGVVDGIGGWSRGEMTIFIGTFSLINALNMVIYFFGVNSLPEKIINGGLDHYLTKPIHPLLWITFENINIGSLPLILLSMGIVGYGATQLAVAPGGADIAMYIVLVAVMTVLWYDLEIILRCLPFYFPTANSLGEIEGGLFELNFKVPGTLFKGIYKILFYFVLPYGIMATVPAQTLAGAASPGLIAYSLLIAALFSLLAHTMWKRGLALYNSASS